MPNQWAKNPKSGVVMPVRGGRPAPRFVARYEEKDGVFIEGWDIACSFEKALEIAPECAEKLNWCNERGWPPAIDRTHVELLGPDECARLDEQYGLKE